MSPSQPPDIEIAQSAELKPIEQVAASLDLAADEIDPYGRTKAKITGRQSTRGGTRRTAI